MPAKEERERLEAEKKHADFLGKWLADLARSGKGYDLRRLCWSASDAATVLSVRIMRILDEQGH